MFGSKKKNIINVGDPNKRVDPLSVQLYSDKIEERYQRDNTYRLSKMKAIEKRYNKPTTSIRKVGDWLHDFVKANGTKARTSYNEIADALGISEGGARVCVSELNYWDGFPFTWIPVPKKPGVIQLSLNNEDDYYSWDLKKEKVIVTNEQVKEKAETVTPKRKKVQKKQKVTNNQKN